MHTIDFQINNFTALSVKILDDVHISTTYSDFSFYPCEMNYLKVYISTMHKKSQNDPTAFSWFGLLGFF
jgi:predicted GNAT superfamily acetyltransferase